MTRTLPNALAPMPLPFAVATHYTTQKPSMKTILVIEDEQAIRANVARILHYGNFQVLEAENGWEGVETARAYLPDLIICDIMMPGLDGYQVFRHLSDQAETAIIPFIFLSAKADRSEIRQGMVLGADDYLTKPFTSAELLQAVSARLTKKASITEPYVNEMKRTVANLSQVAYSDPLTNLPNRILLGHRLNEMVQQLAQQRSLVAVFCINIRRFRNINAVFGQSVGDMVLKAVAQRLVDMAGSDQHVARLGSNEFCLLWSDLLVQEDVQALARQISAELQKPYGVGDHTVDLQVNIGVAMYPTHGNTADQLIARAETAQHWCEKQGGSALQVYNPIMTQVDQEHRQLEVELRQAIAQNEFELYYQPQVNVITGRIIGLEVFLRWNHPRRGVICPADFMAIAEESGLITPIGEWIFSTATQQFRDWQTIFLSPLKLSINLSARQFRHSNLIHHMVRVLQESSVDASSIVVELTETSLMDDLDETLNTLGQLEGIGIGIAIDDFGTGYSSLSQLRRFPISILKIDRSFVNRIPEDKQDASITTAIIALAQTLNLKVIAEGVETVAQLSFLRKQGCYAIQGYICSPPVTADAVPNLLSQPVLLQQLES